MKIINLPNIITCCNVLCGTMSVYFGMQGRIGTACLLIILGAIFDFFDGMTARALHISSPIGKELDSLADLISFGLAPAVLAYQIYCYIAWTPGMLIGYFFVPAIMVAFSALRLAKFNCDERQHLSFIGLPTPANALFWIGLSYVVRIGAVHQFIASHVNMGLYLLSALILLMSYLLICELPMFSLKIKPGHMGLRENRVRYLFLLLVVLMVGASAIIGHLAAAPAFIILLYIIMSILDHNNK